MQELYKKYENYGFTEFDDTIDNFFVYVSSIHPEKGQLNMNHQLAYHPSELHGRCLMHEDFFKFYSKI